MTGGWLEIELSRFGRIERYPWETPFNDGL
jgi:hypothetical protein